MLKNIETSSLSCRSAQCFGNLTFVMSVGRASLRFSNKVAYLAPLVLIVYSLFLSVLADSGLPSIRDRDTPPGLYESNYGDAARGRKVADLDEESVRAYYAAQKIQTENVAVDLDTAQNIPPTEQVSSTRRILYVVGLPLFGKERSETLALVKSLAGEKKKSFSGWLKDLFFLDKKNPEVHIRPIERPTAKWKLLQQLSYVSILPRDITPVNSAVIKQGLQSVAISSSIGISVQLFAQIGEQGNLNHALAIVVPAAVINMAQSAWTTIPRNWWQNYFIRAKAIGAPLVESFSTRNSTTDKISKVLGSIAQQIWMTVFFTLNVYTVGQGSLEKSLNVLSTSGLGDFFKKKWPSMISNLAWRTPAENAIAEYAEAEQKLRPTAELEAAKIRKVVTIIATNLWVYSTLTTMNWEYWGAKWNLGHAGLGVLAALGITAWIKPTIMRVLTKSGRCANQIAALPKPPTSP